jgi:excisionase family DNA binding protein
MDSLTEWYEYVDRLSRPVRRQTDPETAPPPSWRPWLGTPPVEDLDEQIAPDQLPSLPVAAAMPELSQALQRVTAEFVDPTLHDELQPMPEFSVPELQAPVFELALHTPLASLGPALEGPETAEPPPPPEPPAVEIAAAGAGAAPPSEASESEARTALPAGLVGRERERRAEILAQIREHGAGAEARTRSRESRDALMERLLDPTLTLEETAVFLGVCPTTVRRYTNRGQLRHFRTSGNQRRFRLSDVLEFLDSRASEIESDANADQQTASE